MFENVLLPIDMAHPESWIKALPMSAELCGGTGTLHVLGIVHDIGAAMVANLLPDGFEEQALQSMKSDLDAFAAREMPSGVRARVHVGYGHVAETILRSAEDVGADLIVMASHPPDELRSLFVGSYADRVVRHAKVPVLVVR